MSVYTVRFSVLSNSLLPKELCNLKIVTITGENKKIGVLPVVANNPHVNTREIDCDSRLSPSSF